MSESEPNNTFETATVIPADYNFNEPINGSHSGATDDYYAFTPTSTRGIRLLLTESLLKVRYTTASSKFWMNVLQVTTKSLCWVL
jgi:hypothetical protein